MKLRFVKFLTSRENEIERKEDDDGTTASAVIPPGRARACSPPPSPRHHPALSLHPSRPSTAPASSPPRVRRAMSSSCLCPAVSLLPFFFIKLPKQKSVAAIAWRSTQLADPAVLPNDNVARPARHHPCSFIQSGPTATSRSKGRPIHSGWSHRKTKIENELSCFITFIDE